MSKQDSAKHTSVFPHVEELENLPRCDVSVWDAGTTIPRTVVEVHVGKLYEWVAVDRHANPRHVADQLRWLADKIERTAARATGEQQ